MSFILMMIAIGALAWFPQALAGRGRDLPMAMRHGMVGAFLFTGVDHFVHDTVRYLPMMPPFFEPWSLELVWFTGAAEIAGALGLLLPPSLYARLGLPNLRAAAAIGLALMLCCLVIANIHMAIQGTDVHGLAFGRAYLWLRPLLQPLIILWALYAGGVIGRTGQVRST